MSWLSQMTSQACHPDPYPYPYPYSQRDPSSVSWFSNPAPTPTPNPNPTPNPTQASSSGSWESALDILAEKNGHAPGTPVRKPTPLKDP